MYNAMQILFLYKQVWTSPERGGTHDLRNARLSLSTDDSPCTSFDARKFNLNYAKKEMLWYLGADPYDDSIMQHATMWQKLKQPDGSFYSNYGQYVFGKTDTVPGLDGFWRHGDKGEFTGKSQFEFVVEELKRNRNTRRASITLLQPYHLFHDNVDVVCTYAINFAIYESRLHVTVHMRSNDVIFGLSNDAFCFWCIYQMVFAKVAQHYPGLMRGEYLHLADSMHVYERHYYMIQQLVADDVEGFKPIHVPFVTATEVDEYLEFGTMSGEFGQWLKE